MMALPKMPAFTFNHVDQPDKLEDAPENTKQNFDSRGNEIRDYLNNTLTPKIDQEISTTKQAVDDVKQSVNTHLEDIVTQAQPNKIPIALKSGKLDLSWIATTKDINYYVDATGSDDNDGLTSETAFKTITKAISMIPKIVNHTITINVAEGNYTEDVNISGFLGNGKIVLIGGDEISDSYQVQSITIQQCFMGYVEIIGIDAITSTKAGFYVTHVSSAQLRNCSCDVSSSSNGFEIFDASCVTVLNSLVSNRNNGIYCARSRVLSINNSGTGNTTGLLAKEAGVIGKYGTQPEGITAEYITSGGEIR